MKFMQWINDNYNIKKQMICAKWINKKLNKSRYKKKKKKKSLHVFLESSEKKITEFLFCSFYM